MKAKIGLIGLWLVALTLGGALDLWHEKRFLPPPEERESGEVLIDVLGEVKTVMARYLWFRMDLFHEVLDTQGVAAEKQAEVLPLLRIITLLDPSLTDSYDQIVWDLYKGHNDVETAFEILDEGLRRNPESYELNFRKALLLFLEEDYDETRRYAANALTLTKDEVRLADCLRLIYWSAEKDGLVELQRRVLDDILRLRPNDSVFLREKEKLDNLQGRAPATTTPAL